MIQTTSLPLVVPQSSTHRILHEPQRRSFNHIITLHSLILIINQLSSHLSVLHTLFFAISMVNILPHSTHYDFENSVYSEHHYADIG